MPLGLLNTEIDKEKVGHFQFRKLNGRYLITNEIGRYSFLNPEDFHSFLSGNLEVSSPDKYKELKEKFFIRNMLDFDAFVKKYALRNIFLKQSTCLHIIVVTLRCDQNCIYCQANSKLLGDKGFDMDMSTAMLVIDRIFECPNENINIEFQGGEPLANFNVIEFTVGYIAKKNKLAGKKIMISLVTNLNFMTKERLKFCVENNISICTSLDGQESLHNKNRVAKINNYRNVIKWIKAIRKEVKNNKRYKYRINALSTVTRFSLPYPKEIVDEFIALGLEGIHLRPVNPFGLSKKVWQKVSFSPEEFLNFYRKVMNYIIELNLKGKVFYERAALIFLTKILTDLDLNFLDTRSPCGAGIGQLAYNFDGDVYTCDEGRMLSRIGDDSFKAGNVQADTYHDFIDSDAVKTLCSASYLEGLVSCGKCAYKPYCGVCPIYNYVTEGDIFSKIPCNARCAINKGILDYLFEMLSDKKAKSVFERWVSIGK